LVTPKNLAILEALAMPALGGRWAKLAQKLGEGMTPHPVSTILRRKLNPCADAYMAFIEGENREKPIHLRLREVHEAVTSISTELSLALRINHLHPVEINEKKADQTSISKEKLIRSVEVARRSGRLNLDAYESWSKIA
jgi:hypothetical protein